MDFDIYGVDNILDFLHLFVNVILKKVSRIILNDYDAKPLSICRMNFGSRQSDFDALKSYTGLEYELIFLRMPGM